MFTGAPQLDNNVLQYSPSEVLGTNEVSPEQRYQQERGFASPVKLTETQQRAADPEFRAKYPAVAAYEGYTTPYDAPQSQSYRFGEWLTKSTPWMKGPVLGATAGGAAGLAADRGIAAVKNMLGLEDRGVNWWLPFIGAAGGALAPSVLPALAGAQKSGSYMMGGASQTKQELQALVAHDATLTAAQRQQIISRLGGLSATDAARIKRLIASTGGASVGLLIARLLGLNMTASVAASALGAMAGLGFAGSGYSRNALGQLSAGNRPLY